VIATGVFAGEAVRIRRMPLPFTSERWRAT
jgi:hypothetical protein